MSQRYSIVKPFYLSFFVTCLLIMLSGKQGVAQFIPSIQPLAPDSNYIIISDTNGVAQWKKNTLSGGGTVGDDWGDQVVQSDVTLIGNGTVSSVLRVDTSLIATKNMLSRVDSARFLNDTLYIYEGGAVIKAEIITSGGIDTDVDSVFIASDSLIVREAGSRVGLTLDDIVWDQLDTSGISTIIPAPSLDGIFSPQNEGRQAAISNITLKNTDFNMLFQTSSVRRFQFINDGVINLRSISNNAIAYINASGSSQAILTMEERDWPQVWLHNNTSGHYYLEPQNDNRLYMWRNVANQILFRFDFSIGAPRYTRYGQTPANPLVGGTPVRYAGFDNLGTIIEVDSIPFSRISGVPTSEFQTLTWSSGTGNLGITGGNTVNLDSRYKQDLLVAGFQDPKVVLSGSLDSVQFVGFGGIGIENIGNEQIGITGDGLIQDLSFSTITGDLSISGGNTVNLLPLLGTDDQTLSLTGTNDPSIEIEDGNFIPTSGTGGIVVSNVSGVLTIDGSSLGGSAPQLDWDAGTDQLEIIGGNFVTLSSLRLRIFEDNTEVVSSAAGIEFTNGFDLLPSGDFGVVELDFFELPEITPSGNEYIAVADPDALGLAHKMSISNILTASDYQDLNFASSSGDLTITNGLGVNLSDLRVDVSNDGVVVRQNVSELNFGNGLSAVSPTADEAVMAFAANEFSLVDAAGLDGDEDIVIYNPNVSGSHSRLDMSNLNLLPWTISSGGGFETITNQVVQIVGAGTVTSGYNPSNNTLTITGQGSDWDITDGSSISTVQDDDLVTFQGSGGVDVTLSNSGSPDFWPIVTIDGSGISGGDTDWTETAGNVYTLKAVGIGTSTVTADMEIWGSSPTIKTRKTSTVGGALFEFEGYNSGGSLLGQFGLYQLSGSGPEYIFDLGTQSTQVGMTVEQTIVNNSRGKVTLHSSALKVDNWKDVFGNETITDLDFGYVLLSSGITLNVPFEGTQLFHGQIFVIWNDSSGSCSIDPQSGVQINGSSATITLAAGDRVMLMCADTNQWITI